MRKPIYTDKAPKPLALYSQGIIFGDEMNTSGQIGVDLKTGKLVEGFENQARLCFKYNIEIIEAGGFLVSDVNHVTILLADMSFYKRMNDIYEETFKPYFSKGDYPTRVVSAAKELPKKALIEILMSAKKVE